MNEKRICDEVLASQSALAVKRTMLERVKSAIAKQRGIVAEGVGDNGLPQLESRRDDLAATLALGGGDGVALSKIESDIGRLKVQHSEAREQVSRANSALSGLQRKYDEEAATLSSMETAHTTLLLSHLRCEADVVQRAYMDSAREVVSLYLRIIALAELSRSLAPNAGEFAPSAEFAIPVSLQLPSGTGIKYINDGVLFSSAYMGFFNDIPEAVAKVRADLQQAGIDLA